MSQKTQRNASDNTANHRFRESISRPALTLRIPGLALGAIALNAPVLAQQAGATSTTNTDDANQLQEVVVTGIRASLQRSLGYQAAGDRRRGRYLRRGHRPVS